MISVIVPVYKVEKYLQKCVTSILAQTYRDIEVILVDDGSPDRCGEICDELALTDKRITVIHQENLGLAGARNTGLEYVMNKGVSAEHFIAFVDSDDTIHEDMYHAMTSLCGKKYDIAICQHQIIREGEGKINEVSGKIHPLTKEQLWEEVFGKLNNAVWNKLYKAELIRELRFSNGLVHGEDLIFNIQYIARCKNAVLTDAEYYNYTKRSESITTIKFNCNNLMEIEAKDQAKILIKKYCPKQIKNAELFCFRARMNMLRKINASGNVDAYYTQVQEYKKYVAGNYSDVKDKLKMKERIEYFIFTKIPSAYKVLVKYYGK